MNKILLLTGMAVVFISIFSTLSVLTAMADKYRDCTGFMLSGSPECSLATMGKSLITGVMILSMAAAVSASMAFLLIRAATRRDVTSQGYG